MRAPLIIARGSHILYKFGASRDRFQPVWFISAGPSGKEADSRVSCPLPSVLIASLSGISLYRPVSAQDAGQVEDLKNLLLLTVGHSVAEQALPE